MMDMEQGASMGKVKCNVVNDGISLHRIMVWLRVFRGWSKKYQFLPRPQGRGNMVLNATTKGDRSCSVQHFKTVQSSKKWQENSLSLGMTVHGCDGGRQTVIH